MERGWKSEMIENILVSLICIWLGGWKSGGMKNFFVWLKMKFV